jgi:hypothetical protein
MAFTVEHAEPTPDIPTNTLLRAKLISLEVATVPYKDRKTGEDKSFQKLNWVFEITQQGDYHGMTVRAETSAYLSDHPENKFRLWAEALMQRPLDLGNVLSETDLIGLSALITVKYEADRKDAEKKWRRVEDVIALEGEALFDQPPF